MSKTFTAVFNGKSFSVDYVTGKVLDTNTRAETEVHGSGGGGGGFSYQGTGASSSAPVRITSTTTRFTKIFLLDREQREHAIELVDFDVRCRAGNGLTLVWAIQSGKNQGPYIAAFNHNTREMEFAHHVLAKLNEPKLIAVAGGFAAALVLGLILKFGVFALFLGALGIVIGNAVGKHIGKKRAAEFIASADVKALRGDLEKIPASELTVLTSAA